MEKFAKEVQECIEYNKKDTPRKIKLFIGVWIKDLQYIINHIKPQLETRRYKDYFGVYAMHLGQKMREADLKRYEAQLQWLIDNKEGLAVGKIIDKQ